MVVVLWIHCCSSHSSAASLCTDHSPIYVQWTSASTSYPPAALWPRCTRRQRAAELWAASPQRESQVEEQKKARKRRIKHTVKSAEGYLGLSCSCRADLVVSLVTLSVPSIGILLSFPTSCLFLPCVFWGVSLISHFPQHLQSRSLAKGRGLRVNPPQMG